MKHAQWSGSTMTAAPERQPPPLSVPIWRQPDGDPVSCAEKIKVLNENLAEIRQMCQDAFEDALLMGCDERQIRDVLAGVVEGLANPFDAAGDPTPSAAAGGTVDEDGRAGSQRGAADGDS
jgi:hypothetical protein